MSTEVMLPWLAMFFQAIGPIRWLWSGCRWLYERFRPGQQPAKRPWLVTTSFIAQLMNRSESTVRQMAANGELPTVRSSGPCYQFDIREVLDHLDGIGWQP